MSLTTQAGDNVTKNRHKYIGGSDVSTILGLNKFKSPYELALEKTGIVKSDFKGNEYTEYGNIMEPQIRDYVNIVNGTSFIEDTRVNDDLRSNTDGYDSEHSLILEIKTHGKTPTMEAYKAQMQLYMYQFECNEGWLALYERPKDFDAEFDDSRLRIKQVPRDNDFIKNMLEEIKEFWISCEYLINNPGASEDDYKNRTLKGDGEMNELQVKTIKFEPAKVEFNYEELEKKLNENLKKYSGLTFTEDDAAECKKTITELNKGKKMVDEYRKKIKKQLTEPVTAFENQCKDLNEIFNGVINPLKEQHDAFEDKRKEEKQEKVQSIVDQLIEDKGLTEKYAAELIIEDSYLSKSKTIKSITEELNTVAEHLKMKQDKAESDKQIIHSHVELVNAKNDLKLIESTYINLLDYQTVDDVKQRIESDVEKVLEEQRIELERKEQQDALKAQQAARKISYVEQGDVVTEQRDYETASQEAIEVTFFELYEVTATESQFNALEEYMTNNSIAWKIKEEE